MAALSGYPKLNSQDNNNEEIETIMSQTSCTRETAVKYFKEYGNIVDSILEISSNSSYPNKDKQDEPDKPKETPLTDKFEVKMPDLDQIRFKLDGDHFRFVNSDGTPFEVEVTGPFPSLGILIEKEGNGIIPISRESIPADLLNKIDKMLSEKKKKGKKKGKGKGMKK